MNSSSKESAPVSSPKVVVSPATFEASSQVTQSPVHDDSIAYTNSRLGFSLKIPSFWQGYYAVEEGQDKVSFYFVGESQASKIVDEEMKPLPGGYLFSIATEASIAEDRDFLDSIQELGIVGQTKFVSYSSTDCSFCLFDQTDEAGPEERKLMESDWLKVQSMMEQKELVLNSFEAIGR